MKDTMIDLLLSAALITGATEAMAELNWRSNGTPSISCDVTSTESGLLFFGEWKKIELTYYLTDDPSTRLNYYCEATKRLAHDGSCCVVDCKKHICFPRNALANGRTYTLKGETATLNIEPGVSRGDACSRLFNSAGVSAVRLEKQ